jgi:hypothetical protein
MIRPGKPQLRRLTLMICLGVALSVGVACAAAAAQAQGVPDKSKRTPAQRKLDSHLLGEIARRRAHGAHRGGPADPLVRVDHDGRALVEVRAPVTSQLQAKIRRAKGVIVSTSAEYHSILAWVPLLKLEALADDPAVASIVAAPEAMTNRIK